MKLHNVRYVATFLSALRTFSLHYVLKAGAWASPNLFLNHYVQSSLIDTVSKMSHLGGGRVVDVGTVIYRLMQVHRAED